MSMPMYASAEQVMRDKTDYARKGIARGRSVIVMSCEEGVLLIAENPSSTLHKVGEVYDRIGFAAVGRYNEFENLRQAGIRYADTRGFSYDRRDVTGRGLANAYAQTLGTIFSEALKPYEVEICVAEVGADIATDQLYRLTFDGSVVDEPGFVAMGGQSDAVTASVREGYAEAMPIGDAIRLAVHALANSAPDGQVREVPSRNLEAAVLERGKVGRSFRRFSAEYLDDLLGNGKSDAPEPGGSAAEPSE
ncbi:proteasome subunit alpha [Cumulibacter soli]|uniref:proteasome subunit alpha n=1 Tax=Cumulibacter soli TaxID=2546344 RepID=UPI001067A41B|nr:proteasome subunit alpha [Cumulibacter soli]